MSAEAVAVNSTMRAAFFDVDETLISTKSMFVFLRYWIERRSSVSDAYERVVADIHTQVKAGVDRMEINRMYYRLFAGVPLAHLLAAGQDWYRQYRESPTAFIGATLSAIAEHRARGDMVVLISGSFRACLQPLAADVLANQVVCTEPIVDEDGRLTGQVVRPMIGSNKAAAVAETITSLGLLPADCFCYGDHSSDLKMLLEVGHPRVVGGDLVLLKHARRNGWPVLPADPSPIHAAMDLMDQQVSS